MTKKLPNKQSPDYEELGKLLASIYETGYINKGEAYKHSLIKGVLGGLGGVIGATIFVALLVWTLSLFQRVPLVGPFVDRVRETVEVKR